MLEGVCLLYLAINISICGTCCQKCRCFTFGPWHGDNEINNVPFHVFTMSNLLDIGPRIGCVMLSHSWSDRDIAGMGHTGFFMREVMKAHQASFPSITEVRNWFLKANTFFFRASFGLSSHCSLPLALLEFQEFPALHLGCVF